MTDFSQLEPAIAAWREQMLAAGIGSPVPLEELEAHLREEIDRQLQAGLSEPEAFHAAVQSLGPAVPLKTEFTKTTGRWAWFGPDKVTRINRILAVLWLANVEGLAFLFLGFKYSWYIAIAFIAVQLILEWWFFPHETSDFSRACVRFARGEPKACKEIRRGAKLGFFISLTCALLCLFHHGAFEGKICFLAWSAYSFFLCLATLRHLPANGTAAPKPAR